MITSFVRTSRAQRAVTPYAPQVYEFQTVFYSSSLKIHSSCTLYTLKRAGLLVACITTLYNSRNIQIRGVEKFSAMPDNNFEHHESGTCQAPCINMECWKKKKHLFYGQRNDYVPFNSSSEQDFPVVASRGIAVHCSQHRCAGSLQFLPLGVCALWSRLLVLF